MALIYGELDINVPEISYADIEKFIIDTKIVHELSTHSQEEKIYAQRNNRSYPWERRLLEFNGKEFHNYKNIQPFNDLVNLIDSLPIDRGSRVVLLLSQKEQDSYDFNFHFDKDDPHGFRICFGLNINQVFLEIAPLKSEFLQLSNQKIEDHMLEPTLYKVIPKKANTVFCLPGNKYPHRVPVNNSTRRTVLIVRGKVTTLSDLAFLHKVE